MKNVHEVWAIVSVSSGGICFNKNGQMCTYKTQQEAVLEMANAIKNHPDKGLVLKRTRVLLPWI